MLKSCILLAISAAFGVLACLSTGAVASDLDELKQQYRRPAEIPFPETAPYSLHMATLGKMLFYDPRLSGAQNMNCASCHNPSFGYETPVPLAIGAANTPLPRHAPTVLNHAWTPLFFWDGRAASLEEQAAGPITAAAEMNGDFDIIVQRLSAIPEYARWFDRLFPGEGVSRAAVLQAIATYERTIVTGAAPFDRWIEGDEQAISEPAKRGFMVFNGKANCSICHGGWNFTDNLFHDIGLPSEDEGRIAIVPGDESNRHAFKTPNLRNLTYRAPFMHDGSLPDLEAVIVHYETGGVSRPSLSPDMLPLVLSDGERNDLLAFLQSLTAERTETPVPILPN